MAQRALVLVVLAHPDHASTIFALGVLDHLALATLDAALDLPVRALFVN
jgi:hypothetical protein